MKDAPKHRIPQPLADEFVATQKQGTLAAQVAGGFPQMTLLPFVRTGDLIELHCVQADPTFRALKENPKVAFLVSEYLSVFPSRWADPEDGGRGSTVYRAVNFECHATWDTTPDAVAAALTKLLSVYEPGAPKGHITDGPVYGARLRQLASVKLTIVSTQAKFKIGPAGAEETARRANVARELRRRDQPGDANAAHWIDHYNSLRGPDGSWSV
ncbi:MAG: FMN-binding negative transcriptional regulator [Proteobacteria bacterium]|nr:FMN-binding negative transcriptional regulator [Pseudomonadota bacterium]